MSYLASMQTNTTDIPARTEGNNELDTADAVARAAHIWIRSLCLTELQAVDERYALACGLVVGLCERLQLDPRVRDLVAYVYALLDNEGTQALTTSRSMLSKSIPAEQQHAYKKGREEAAAIVEMLAYHNNRAVLHAC